MKIESVTTKENKILDGRLLVDVIEKHIYFAWVNEKEKIIIIIIIIIQKTRVNFINCHTRSTVT